MGEWVFPSTLFLFGFIVWLFSYVFTQNQKQIFGVMSIISGVIIAISFLLLLQRGYTSFAGVLFCIMTFIVILYLGFTIPLSKTKAEGPWGELLGSEGIAKTPLSPKGEVEVGDQKVQATTEGLFIGEGTKVKIIRTAEKIVVVEKIT